MYLPHIYCVGFHLPQRQSSCDIYVDYPMNRYDARLILTPRLPQLPEGEHVVQLSAIIALPDGSLKRHVLTPLILSFSADAAVAPTVADITVQWAEKP